MSSKIPKYSSQCSNLVVVEHQIEIGALLKERMKKRTQMKKFSQQLLSLRPKVNPDIMFGVLKYFTFTTLLFAYFWTKYLYEHVTLQEEELASSTTPESSLDLSLGTPSDTV